MGIKDLKKVIKKEAPSQLFHHKLSELGGYKVAIDISIFLYQYFKSSGDGLWLNSFVHLLCILKKHKISAICIFDGPNIPPEKRGEQDRRRASTENMREKRRACKAMKRSIQKGMVDLDDIPIQKQIRELIGAKRKKIYSRIQQKEIEVDTIDFTNPDNVIRLIDEKMDNLARQTAPITSNEAELAKIIIQLLGITYYQADGEAETLCAYLCVKGKVDAVLSRDTDVLAYGTPLFFSELDIKAETVEVVQYEEMLEEMGMTHEQFVDMCILLSCDYNERCKTYTKKGKPTGMGPVKIVPNIREYGSIEAMENTVIYDSEPLKYRRCRELFTVPEKMPILDKTVKELGSIGSRPNMNSEEQTGRSVDFYKVEQFLKENKVYIDIGYIKKLWKPTQLVFE